MKAAKKETETKFVLTLSEEEAGLLMSALTQHITFDDCEIAGEVYVALEDAGADEC